MTSNVLAVILRQEDWRENDVLVTMYTREYGKLEAVAKGLRKIESKLVSHLEPLTTAEIFIVQGRRWPIVAGSFVENPRFSLRTDLSHLVSAGAIAHLIDLMTPLENPDERIYGLLEDTLSIVTENFLEPATGQLLVHLFAWKMLAATGYRPQLKICLQCHHRIAGEKFFFSPRRGGIIHSRCHSHGQLLHIEIKTAALKGLTYMLEAPMNMTLRLRGERQAFIEMTTVISRTFEERFEIPFPAIASVI